MAYWLFKTEPGDYSWEQFVSDGATDWDGVHNYQAALNMRAMKVGERAFFYRSMKNPAIVGVMEITRDAYPDPDNPDGKFVRVDVKPIEPVKQEVSLKAVKAEPRLANLALVRQSRLSVMPIGDEEWALLRSMAGLDP